MDINVNGTRLWFDVDGPALVPSDAEMRHRPTVILLHGGPGSFDHSYFKPDFSRITAIAQVVYLDLRDHGRSEWGDPADWSVELCGDDVRAFCDTLGIVKPIVLGHSLGGPVAIAYAAQHPDHPGGLVLLSTFARFDLEGLVSKLGELGGDEIADIARRAYTRSAPVTADEWDRCWAWFGKWVPGREEKGRVPRNDALNQVGLDLLLRLDLSGRLSRITCPTLVCAGDLDPVGASDEIIAGLPSGVGRSAIVEDAGHFPWRDAPERFWPVLESFVGSVV